MKVTIFSTLQGTLQQITDIGCNFFLNDTEIFELITNETRFHGKMYDT